MSQSERPSAPGARRIVYIEKATAVGGSITALFELVQAIDRDRFEPVILFYGPNEFSREFEAIGVRCEFFSTVLQEPPHRAGTRDLAASLSRYGNWLGTLYRHAKQIYLVARSDWFLAARFRDKLNSLKPDLVHHNTSIRADRVTVLAAWRAGLPQVCHARMINESTIMERVTSRAVDAFIFSSQALADQHAEIGVQTRKGQLIYEAFDFRDFDSIRPDPALREEFGISPDAPMIVNVGRIDTWKGHPDFVNAIEILLEKWPDAKALIVGAPDDTAPVQRYFADLQNQVRESGLEQHVIFTGFRTDVPRIMATASVVVHSATEPEPFGRVIVEGMLARTPVVATAAGGPLETIDDESTGLLVPMRDPGQMAAAIDRLLSDDDLHDSIVSRADSFARERFKPANHARAVEKVYERVLAGRQN